MNLSVDKIVQYWLSTVLWGLRAIYKEFKLEELINYYGRLQDKKVELQVMLTRVSY